MKKKKNKLWMLAKLGCVLLLAILFARSIHLQLQIGKLNAQSAELDKEIVKKTTVNEELRKSLKAGNTDESIAKIARDVLGYASPGEKVYKDSSEQ